jgi:peptidoglycan hydrolase-like protein with peptidoglycan-binding domain
MYPLTKRHRAAGAVTAILFAAAMIVAGGAIASAHGVRGSHAPQAGGCTAYRENNQYPLTRCDKGEAIRLLQTALRVVEPNLAVDGYFGVLTEGALLEYEQTRGLPVVDGIVDAETWLSLTRQYARGHDGNANGIIDPWELGTGGSPPPSATCASYRADYAYPMQLCGRGEGVRVAQLAIQTLEPTLAADGYFGPLTQAAVARFQEGSGLPPTGEIDEPTWRLLTGIGQVDGYDADGDGIIDPWELGLPEPVSPAEGPTSPEPTTWAVVIGASASLDDPHLRDAIAAAEAAGYDVMTGFERVGPTGCSAGAVNAFLDPPIGGGGITGYHTASVIVHGEAAAHQAASALATLGLPTAVTLLYRPCLA